MKTGTESKAKFKRLQRRLGQIPIYACVGILESVWQLTARDAPAGDIGRLTNDDIAACLEWEGDADDLVDSLVECGWIDRCAVHRLIVHDWEEHCPNYIRANMKRHDKEFAKQVAKEPVEVAKEPQNATKEPVEVTKEPQNVPEKLLSPIVEATTKPSLVKPSGAERSAAERSGVKSGQAIGASAPVNRVDGRELPCSVDEFFDRWNGLAAKKGLKPVRACSDDRKRKLKLRLKQEGWWELFLEACTKLPLPEGKDSNWQPDFDWFVANETNVAKIVEGKYDWRAGNNGQAKNQGVVERALERYKSEETPDE